MASFVDTDGRPALSEPEQRRIVKEWAEGGFSKGTGGEEKGEIGVGM